MIFAAGLLGAGLLGCGGATAGSTPEETAKTYAELRSQQLAEEWEERYLQRKEKEMERQNQEIGLWADQGQVKRDLDLGEVAVDFIDDHWGEISDIEYDIVKILETSKSTKKVTVKFYYREPVQKEGHPRQWYLGRREREDVLSLSLIEGKWRITDID